MRMPVRCMFDTRAYAAKLSRARADALTKFMVPGRLKPFVAEGASGTCEKWSAESCSVGENPKWRPEGAALQRQEAGDQGGGLLRLVGLCYTRDMPDFAAPVERLIDELKHLPGIGQKTAQRLAFYLLRDPGGGCAGTRRRDPRREGEDSHLHDLL